MADRPCISITDVQEVRKNGSRHRHAPTPVVLPYRQVSPTNTSVVTRDLGVGNRSRATCDRRWFTEEEIDAGLG